MIVFHHSKLTVERRDQSQLGIRCGSAKNVLCIITAWLYNIPPAARLYRLQKSNASITAFLDELETHKLDCKFMNIIFRQCWSVLVRIS